MNVASRFSRIKTDPAPDLELVLDDVPVRFQAGDTVAAVVLAHSGGATRTTPAGMPRAPFCMMGCCFECLMEIDGQGNVQACMTPARNGMVVRRQTGARVVDLERGNG